MADRIVLHVGGMKTGTSFVQSVLYWTADIHERAGLLFLAKSYPAQVSAVKRVLATPKRPERHDEWRALVQEARDFDGEAAIVSMEFMSFAKRHQVDAFMAPLEGMDVQVVLTVRDQFAAIPAQWQSYVRRFGVDPWSTYLQRIDPSRQKRDDANTHAAKGYTRAQRVDLMLERWGTHPGVGKLDVITTPDRTAPKEELWNRFAGAIGVDPSLAVDVQHRFDNSSLGYASAEVMRRLNPYLMGVPAPVYRIGLRPLVWDALTPRRQAEGKPALDRRAAEFARASNQRIRDAITAGGYEVHGSLDALPVPASLPRLARKAADPDKHAVKDAADALWDRTARELDVDASARPKKIDAVIADLGRMIPLTPRWREALAERTPPE